MTSASGTRRIGLLGGTLDPIHCGHLDAAAAARNAFHLNSVLIVPAHVPPHRAVQPVASPFHRFAMAALAVSSEPGLLASDDELRMTGPSYTADTLDRLHAAGWGASQIFFIIGVDAFAEIAAWHRYPEVLDLASFVVVARPGHPFDTVAARLPALASRMKRPDDVDSLRAACDLSVTCGHGERFIHGRPGAHSTWSVDPRPRAAARRGAHPSSPSLSKRSGRSVAWPRVNTVAAVAENA